MSSAVGFIMSSVVRFHYVVCGEVALCRMWWVVYLKRNSLRERVGEALTSLLLNEIPYGKSCSEKNLYKSV